MIYVDPDGNIAGMIILGIIGLAAGFGVASYIDSKDGDMYNGDVMWYDYLGASVVGGILGAFAGALAGSSFSFSIPTLGYVNSGGAISIGVTGTATITVSGAQVLTGIGAGGISIMMAKSIGKYGGYEVKHNYPNDHEPLHVHIYGDDIHRGSHGIRVGLDGNPLKGEPKLSPGAKRAIKQLMDRIIKVLSEWM